MMSFRPAAPLALLLLLGSLAAPHAAAQTVYTYEGTFTLCIGTCNSFAALGGPGGSANTVPSVVTGSITINVGPSDTFVATDVQTFAFEIFNSGASAEAPMFDGMGNLTNPTTTNPLPLTPAVAQVTAASGATDSLGRFTSGSIEVTFTAPPFSNNGAVVTFNLSDSTATGFLFGGAVQFTAIAPLGNDTGFTLPLPPPQLQVAPTQVNLGSVAVGGAALSGSTTITNIGGENLTLMFNTAGISAPLSVNTSACPAALIGLATCNVTFALSTATAGDFSGSIDVNTNGIVTRGPGNTRMAVQTVGVNGSVTAPGITISPVMLTVPQTVAGQTGTANVTVTSSGNGPLTIGMVAMANTLAGPFSITADTCSAQVLAPMATCMITVQFAPGTVGQFNDSFDIPSDDADGPDTVTVMAEAVSGALPEIASNPTAAAGLNLGQVLLTAAGMGNVTITNTGTATLNFTSIGISGSTEFAQTNTCAASLAVQANCVITVTLNATSGGVKTGSLDIVSDAAMRPNLMIGLTAEVIDAPVIAVAPQSLQIGSMAAPVELDTSAMGSVTVTNNGTQDLMVSGATVAPANSEFTVAGACLSAAVTPGNTCTLDITFSPVTAGDKMATVSIASNDPANPSVNVAVTGFVFRGARAAAAPSPLPIGTQAVPVPFNGSQSGTVTVTSNGTDDLVISTVVLSGNSAAQMTLMETCTAAALPRGSTCTVTIQLTPDPTSGGPRAASIDFTANTSPTAFAVPVAGFASFPPTGPAPGSQTNTPPEFALRDTDSEGCFVATAAYGSYLDPRVQVLRDFRDDVLLRSTAGRRFVAFYYTHSPRYAAVLMENESLRAVARVALTPLVYALAYPFVALAMLGLGWFGLRRRRRRKLA